MLEGGQPGGAQVRRQTASQIETSVSLHTQPALPQGLAQQGCQAGLTLCSCSYDRAFASKGLPMTVPCAHLIKEGRNSIWKCVIVHKFVSGRTHTWAPLVPQLVKNPPAMWETWVRSLDWEDPPEEGKATHSSILAWRIPWTFTHRYI